MKKIYAVSVDVEGLNGEQADKRLQDVQKAFNKAAGNGAKNVVTIPRGKVKILVMDVEESEEEAPF